MFEVSVDTTYENIFMVLEHTATSRTNIKVAHKMSWFVTSWLFKT